MRLKENDRLAYQIIGTVSVVVFLVVASLGKFKLLNLELSFDPHIFATINAFINSAVSICLLFGFYFIKNKKIELHKKTMFTAMILSSLFLVSYICHHLLTTDTHFGGEGFVRWIYYPLLITHIFLAATILPFILLSMYRALSGNFEKHKKIARITFPIWLYVSVSGVIVYLFISPYY